MGRSSLKEQPIVGDLIFRPPRRGKLNWIFFTFALLWTVYLFLTYRPETGLIFGPALLLATIPDLLPKRAYRIVVATRIIGFIYILGLVIASLTFLDPLSFF